MMGKVPPEMKRDAGKAFNEAKNSIQAMLDAAKERIGGGARSNAAKIDVTLPGANGRSDASIRSARPLTSVSRSSAGWVYRRRRA
jgi:hypothetical protein